ncbi:metal-dependent hydrolase family protein [Prauserella alba]|uniref:metal-dependent hydrolase family protein n=1 Tax=Prauserella alba TaxID=176898 RepID=UPI0020A60CB9|nr:amidohydrolase family protein [Prauserella alba]MCP2181330.1 Imidazolonepropionase [Prauserella alba]
MTRLLLTEAHVLDPETADLSDSSWIEVAGGRIADVGTGRAPTVPDGVPVLRLGGATVLPGLIDAHVHAVLTSADAHAVAGWSPSYRTARATSGLAAMLERGFTTVRDTGGADHGLAQAVEEGIITGPRIVYGGSAISQTGGHGDFRTRDEDSVPCCQTKVGGGRIADGVGEVRRVTRDELRKGASHIKIMLSGGVASPNDEVSAVQYSEEEIRAFVEEATNANRYVTGHAYHARAINRGLANGVRCIEHGNLLDDSSVELFLEHDAWLVPTLITYDRLAADGPKYGLPPGSHRKVYEVLDAGLGALEKAHRAGVNLAYGTDLLGAMGAYQLHEFRVRGQVQPAADVVRSATADAARLLGMEGEVGVVAGGAHADLLVVDGNPLEDLEVLVNSAETHRYVIQGGRIVVGRCP